MVWLYILGYGKTGLYLDWNIGMGVSTTTGGYEFFPTNWFFMFVNRDGILYALSFFLMIKLELVAFAMSFYIKKRYRSTVITVSSGVLYALCGFVLQYYTNIDFIDFTIMLPLIVYALERLMMEHKHVLFMIFLFFMFMCSIQLLFMLCMYIVFKSYFVIKDVPVESRARSIRLLVISVVVSAFLSCFVFIPEVLTLITSVRVTKGATGDGGGFNYFEQMRYVYNYFRRQKQFMLYGGEMAVGLFLYIIIRGKNIVKKYLDNIAMIAIVGLPILHEGINLLWHMGSYKHFPVRLGYMLTFECLVFVAKFWHEDGFITIKHIGRIAKLIGIAAVPFVAYVLFGFFREFTEKGISDLSPYHTYWLYLLTLASMYFLIFLMDSMQSRKCALVVIALIQGFCGCYGLIAPDAAKLDRYRNRYVLNSIELRSEFNGLMNRTDRIKMEPLDYDPNDSEIVGQPTISYWSYGINEKTEEELQGHMEYDGQSTCTLDSGGTVFTDALLGVKYTTALSEPDKTLYSKVESKNNVYISNFSMPFGLVLYERELNDNSAGFEYQNEVFRKIVETDEELISIKLADDLVDDVNMITEDELEKLMNVYVSNGPKDAYVSMNESEISDTVETMDMNTNTENASNEEGKSEGEDEAFRKYELTIETDNHSAIYLFSDKMFNNTMLLMIDEKPVYTGSIETYGHFDYPNDMINGILSLGTVDNENMKLDIYTTNSDLKGVKVGLLDLDVLTNGIEAVKKNQNLTVECGRSNMNVTGNVNKAGTLFLPMGYSDNWYAKLNGKRVEVRPYINDAFIAVDVPRGNIDIEFSYRPKGLIIGILFSFVGLILEIFVLIFEKRGGIEAKKCKPIVDNIFIYSYYTVVAALFIVMYVVPIWIKMSL